MKGRVLLVGCGEIGSRHLQAIASLSQVEEVEIVDPRPEAHALGKERLHEALDRRSEIRYRWIRSLEEAAPSGGLCIIATQASGRSAIVRQAAGLGYRTFLLEKIVTQSVEEYDELLTYSRNHSLSVWVNCKSRAYPFHKQAAERMDPEEPIQFLVAGGNHGLATNGIHIVDLFVHYDRCRRLIPQGSRLDSILHPSKRGKNVYDMSGTLQAVSEKGSFFSLTFARDHQAPPCFMVTSRAYRFLLVQDDRWAYEADASSRWAWRPIPFEGNLLISNMSRRFVSDLLEKGSCELPTLEECFPAHEFLLGEIKTQFRLLTSPTLEHCPVT
ncbi:MAG: Gfo/Idh/MocA family oxidoreductase [Candidatus Omnitrophica bacterium]|nr:Gfo/Idh/MocA family oxidoreductase [Candidatus Omnitrophota bacterium]